MLWMVVSSSSSFSSPLSALFFSSFSQTSFHLKLIHGNSSAFYIYWKITKIKSKKYLDNKKKKKNQDASVCQGSRCRHDGEVEEEDRERANEPANSHHHRRPQQERNFEDDRRADIKAEMLFRI